jgi:23S rRNA pseudouridine2605 synthase/16S rRNA pseudouridine516 synthase
MPDEASEGVRLQKVLAAAGIASRRASEELIAAGRVAVNGRVVTEAGTRIDPTRDRVAVDGAPVQVDPARRTVLLNKPVGVVSSMRDEQGRRDLREFTARYEERLFNVGRLDQDTSGLLLLTNDGDLAHVLAHPSFGVEKTYVALVRGQVAARTLGRLTRGIELDDGPIAADRARVIGTKRGATLVELTLHSGRNRIVRRMLDAVGHPVQELVRRRFGPVSLGDLAVGATRDLTRAELSGLLALAQSPEPGAGDPRPNGGATADE